jgi:NAD(P)-dependent dehydrogenase (short-subunit alcohol dehydrogenase family)
MSPLTTVSVRTLPNAVCSQITRTGQKAISVQADVSAKAGVRRMVAEVEAQLGGIDILVNNAAIAHPRKLEERRSTLKAVHSARHPSTPATKILV